MMPITFPMHSKYRTFCPKNSVQRLLNLLYTQHFIPHLAAIKTNTHLYTRCFVYFATFTFSKITRTFEN